MEDEKSLQRASIGEIEGRPSKTLDFFELTKAEEASLRERVEKCDGLVRIFIHPYFETKEKFANQRRFEKLKAAIERAIDEWLRNNSDDTPPILLMEEAHKLDSLRERLDDDARLNSAYLVPTETKSPVPLPPLPDSLQARRFNEEKKWDIFFKKLKALGVKKIIIGGQLLQTGVDLRQLPSWDALREPLTDKQIAQYFGRCVGTALPEFATHFPIEISSLSAPHARLDIKLLEDALKRMLAASKSKDKKAQEDYNSALVFLYDWTRDNLVFRLRED